MMLIVFFLFFVDDLSSPEQLFWVIFLGWGQCFGLFCALTWVNSRNCIGPVKSCVSYPQMFSPVNQMEEEC